MAKISSISSFKKLPGALITAISIIAVLYCVELFMLPINFFTFRAWEALVVGKFLSGNFYPNMKISMIETGDLGHHTKYAVPKRVRWETDKYGCRKADTGIDRYRIVIVGDSDTVGSGLTQKEMLSEVLERRLNRSVYPFTGGDFFSTKRFTDNPPDIVILESIERLVPKIRCVLPGEEYQGRFPQLKKRFRLFWDSHKHFAILLDRVCKNNMAHYLTNRIDFLIKYPVYLISGRDWMPAETTQSMVDKKMLFLKCVVDEMMAEKDILPEEIERIISTITKYRRICKQRGIRFIFLPIPNKESTYYKYLPIKNRRRPRFLEDLVLKLRDQSIEAIDAPRALSEAHRQNGILLFHTDDTHLNARGIKAVADLVEKTLEKEFPDVK